MLFNSAQFLAFFALVLLVYWRLPRRGQNLFLLAASLLFYGCWDWRFLPLILFSASVDYAAGLALPRLSSAAARRACLGASLVANLGLLGFFKYGDFFAESFNALASSVGLGTSLPVLHVVLPVGISFYTFQSLSYTVDVYRGQLRPCRDYLDFLLYVSYFPQLVAGPIERGSRLIPKLQRPRRFTTGRLVDGVKLMLIGYFQKVAIADTLAPIVESVFSDPGGADPVTAWSGAFGFVVQVYGDFSGYSKIARGASLLMGISLMQNFAQPLLSTSLLELWRRWHISLSTFLRDYVYFPLGGSRRSEPRVHLNLIATMAISGLWHGAAWTFVVFGLLHGVLLSANRLLHAARKPRDDALARAGKHAAFLFVWTVSLVLFRGTSFGNAMDMLRAMAWGAPAFGREAAYVLFYAVVSFSLDLFLERTKRGERDRYVAVFSRRWPVETLVFTMMTLWILLLGENHAVPFVYFQF